MTEGNVKLDRPAKTQSRSNRARGSHTRTGAAGAAKKSRPRVGTLARTRTLMLAALRVWELKQGIRE
jgi:hypothetical protein